ncbi:MAG TPA: hypothetical protein G4O08_01900 [Anaerolineae bacterium]|nr:hypothetical protein [Anaerolineae bacterium]
MTIQERRRTQGLNLGLVLAIVLSIGFYLWMSWRTLGLAFPLDDAWIHQSYARNLALRGEWAFLPGQPSAGSTSPLWAAVLAGGHALGLDPRAWTYGMGTILLGITAWLGARWVSQRQGSERSWHWLAALLLVFEWHLVWAAISGMEVPAMALLVVVVLYALDGNRWRALFIGFLIGLGVWLRPDAVLLALAAAWVIMTRERFQIRRILKAFGGLLLGMALPIAPYLVFNRLLSGAWWPTTFYAKQAEYAILRQTPLLQRVVEQAGLPLVGVIALLLPGIVLGGVRAIRSRQWFRFAPLLWVCLHLGAYALRLPLDYHYQHGRYAMPTVPILLILGVEGLLGWLQLDTETVYKRVISRAWLASVIIVAAIFWFLGAQAYARDVAIIESEMVATAHWVRENTHEDDLIAAHDIGAMGYFGEREILDLAGLVDPIVIPYIRDEQALEALLDAQQADYLVTFPGWYPQLISGGTQVFTTNGSFSPLAGGENMTVYLWRK